MVVKRTLLIITFVLIITSIYLIFARSPIDKNLGVSQKIFYYHVSSAWVSFVGFFITFIFSILYLMKKTRKIDLLASSYAEVSFIYLTILMVTGVLWSKPTWGIWWTWDPRLTTALILWCIYAGYMLIRVYSREPERKATLSAVFAIFGFVDVPIVFMAIRWWRTLHPLLITTQSSGMSPPMLLTFILSLITFTALFFAYVWMKIGIEMQSEELEDIKQIFSERMEE